MICLLLATALSARDFSGSRALDFTRRAVAFGPRPPDSPAIHKLQTYILAQLKTDGCEVTEDKFSAKTPQGPVPMKNILCRFAGKSGKAIVYTGHYDTKAIPNFAGANDGGSSTGFLLEMASALSGSPRQDDVYLVFFDGEEAFGEWTDANSLYGSRHLAEKWQTEGFLSRIKALVNVDMIGDKDLGLVYNSGSAASIEKLVWDTAARLGYAKYFLPDGGVSGDDHVPFIERGVKALDLIDFDYGPNNRYWHTPEDTLDKLSAQSLQVVGTVLQKLLPELEAQR
ncbi:MAG: M28 family peptidase [Acidobacteriota bacterium]|nr:M28 family peptidase [Acidobacteriota bacterium]